MKPERMRISDVARAAAYAFVTKKDAASHREVMELAVDVGGMLIAVKVSLDLRVIDHVGQVTAAANLNDPG